MITIKKILKNSKIEALDIELILSYVLKKPREFLITHPETKINSYKVIKLIKLREQGVPLAYLTGHKEFFGLDFFVNKNVLIPRPETELIIDLVLQKLQTKNLELGTILIDVGTGSGCIPISINKHYHLPTFATDISKPALVVAKKNAKLHKVKIKFLAGNLLQPFLNPSITKSLNQTQLIITANLPYLTPKQFKSEPTIKYEPKNALIAGYDGLKYYRELLKQISQLTKKYNLKPISYLEIDPSQTKHIKEIIKKYLPKLKIVIHQDLAGKNRIVEIQY